MGVLEQVPMVRCRLNGPDPESSATLRYIPLAEFELWQHLMETRHGRAVAVEEVSLWVSEQAAWWNSGYAAENLVPVLRVRFERPGPHGVPVPIERFFPAETYPQAQEALLRHFEGPARPRNLAATPGYFIPTSAPRPTTARSA